MVEFHVEITFRLTRKGNEPLQDLDLLGRFRQQLETLAGDLEPVTTMVGGHYAALLTIDALTPLEAGDVGAKAVTKAMTRALAEGAIELEEGLFAGGFDRLHVDRTEMLFS